MDKKIVQFDSHHQKEPDGKVPVIRRGSIYFDLLTSCDGNNVYISPCFELEDHLSDDLLESFYNALKNCFPQAIDKLFEIYRSDL